MNNKKGGRLAVLVILMILALLPIDTATHVKPIRLESSDIEADPYIMIYKADGNYPMNHWVNPDCTHPIIYVNNNSASIKVSVGISGSVYYPREQGTLMNAGGYLTKVSYSASWLGNNEIIAYSDDSVNHKGGFQFNLTDIPYGNHSFSVSASCMILLFEDGFSSTYPVPQSASQGVSFTVAHTSAQPNDSSQTDSSEQSSIQSMYAYAIIVSMLVASAGFIVVLAKKLKPKVAN